MTESQTLLAEYVKNGSEAAFRELVARYVDFVYSAAARLVDGAPHLAEDVTQIVFADLARMSGTLAKEVMLGGWLHRHTCFVAAKTMRSERRRQTREGQAVLMHAQTDHSPANLAQVTPMLDDAINRLGADDRTAILLRFFEQRDLRSIGVALGSNEEAARKRVGRALEKLHVLLKHRGVTLSVAALGAALAAEAVSAAPVEFAATLPGSALAAAAAGSGNTLTLVKIMAMTKLKISVVSAVVIAGLTASFWIDQKAQAKLRVDEEALRQQAQELAQLKSENDGLSTMVGQARAGRNPVEDLTRLRAEAGALRQQTNGLAQLREENRQLQEAVHPKPKTAMQLKEEFVAKANYGKNWMIAFFEFAGKNQGQFPASFDQAESFLDAKAKTQSQVTSDQFEIVCQGAIAALPNPADVVVLREKDPTENKGKWTRVYAFADGHVEVKTVPDGNFEDWEAKHILPAAAK